MPDQSAVRAAGPSRLRACCAYSNSKPTIRTLIAAGEPAQGPVLGRRCQTEKCREVRRGGARSGEDRESGPTRLTGWHAGCKSGRHTAMIARVTPARSRDLTPLEDAMTSTSRWIAHCGAGGEPAADAFRRHACICATVSASRATSSPFAATLSSSRSGAASAAPVPSASIATRSSGIEFDNYGSGSGERQRLGRR